MKKAVIVVGPHFSGKSKTINKHFKHRVGLTEEKRKFTLKGKDGYVLSQSAEEKRLSNLQDFLKRYLKYHWLVLAARPEEKDESHYKSILAILKRNGFSVETVIVEKDQPESYYVGRGKSIFSHLTQVKSGAA